MSCASRSAPSRTESRPLTPLSSPDGSTRRRIHVQVLFHLPRTRKARRESRPSLSPFAGGPEAHAGLPTSQTFIAGESYAGQYIPYIADAILKTTQLPTKLKGLLIGNGWIDPINQYPAYLEFALAAGVVKKGSDVEKDLRKQVDSCTSKLKAMKPAEIKIHNAGCEGILGGITDSTIQRCVLWPLPPYLRSLFFPVKQREWPKYVCQQLRRAFNGHAPVLRDELAARSSRSVSPTLRLEDCLLIQTPILPSHLSDCIVQISARTFACASS